MKKILFVGLILCGCAGVKPKPCPDYTLVLAGKDREISQLKEEELFEEALTEDAHRDLVKLQDKVDKFLKFKHGCIHTGMLR